MVEDAKPESGNGREKRDTTWVIARWGDAFKIYAPAHPADIQTVHTSGLPTCTCREYSSPGRGERVPCIHIQAVLAARGGRLVPHPSGSAIPPTTPAPDKDAPERTSSDPSDDAARHMLLKRSVSPDGRIDSLSVEISLPVSKLSVASIRASASKALALQSDIVEGFLGKKETAAVGVPEPELPGGTLYARIKGIRGTDTKWGRRLYLMIQVNGDQLRCFGSPKRIAELLGFAGFPEYANRVAEGLELDLACRVSVEPSTDGRFMNVRRVFPAKN